MLSIPDCLKFPPWNFFGGRGADLGFVNALNHIILSDESSKLTWFTYAFNPSFKSTFQSIMFPLYISLNSARILHRISKEMYEILWPLHIRILQCFTIPKRTHVCETYRPRSVCTHVAQGTWNCRSDRLNWHLNLWLLTVT